MSLYALHLPNGRTSNTGVFRLLGRLLSGTGVVESTAFTVSAQGTPDMTVKVSGSTVSDNLVIITTGGDTYHGWNTANTNVTITSNATGVTKKDHIVAYIDTALTTTTADNPGGLVLVAVRGTGTAAPTDAEIIAVPAIGSKPWMRLAEITVGNGVGSINSGNIVDLRTFAGIDGSRVKSGTLPFSATTGIWWEELGRTTLGSTGDTITVSSLPTRKYLKVLFSLPNSGSIGATMTFNGDTGANYATRNAANGAADASGGSANSFTLCPSGTVYHSGELLITNVATLEKIVSGATYNAGTTGAANVPNRFETVSKWANTSSAISSITLTNPSTGDYAAGAEMIVLGHN